VLHTAAFRQSCGSGSETLQVSSLLGLDGFTPTFHTTALACTVAILPCQSCATLWEGTRISGAYWLGHVNGTARETFLQAFPRLLAYGNLELAQPQLRTCPPHYSIAVRTLLANTQHTYS